MPARTDKTTDPELAAALLLARRGQAYFSRKLQELRDDQLRGESGLEGWSRSQLVSHVGLNARALTHLTEWARTGVETPMYDSPTQRSDDIEFTATLPVHALRNLSDHAAIHLNVEWRDLTDEEWSHSIRTAQGRVVPVRETVWMRTREVWVHAVDLANGGSFDDFPPELVDALLTDVVRTLLRPSDDPGPELRLELTDRVDPVVVSTGGEDSISLIGTASNIARWATGRGSDGVVNVNGGNVPAPRRWL